MFEYFFVLGKFQPYNRCSASDGREIIILPWNEVLLLFFYIISPFLWWFT